MHCSRPDGAGGFLDGTRVDDEDDALTTYAGELRCAHDGAQRTLDRWNEGASATAQAGLDRIAAVAAYNDFITRPCQPSLSGIHAQPSQATASGAGRWEVACSVMKSLTCSST